MGILGAMHGKFQFTPLREGRLASPETKFGRAQISIHAPPRGATERTGRRPKLVKYFNSRPSARGDFYCKFSIFCRVFQFTPLREGRRLFFCANPEGVPDFNSRPSARGDFRGASAYGIAVISIHAPPRGATVDSLMRTSVGRFQFTPLREGRPCTSELLTSRTDFNSRPSARGD